MQQFTMSFLYFRFIFNYQNSSFKYSRIKQSCGWSLFAPYVQRTVANSFTNNKCRALNISFKTETLRTKQPQRLVIASTLAIHVHKNPYCHSFDHPTEAPRSYAVSVGTGGKIHWEKHVQLYQARHGQEADVHRQTGEAHFPVELEAIAPERQVQAAQCRQE